MNENRRNRTENVDDAWSALRHAARQAPTESIPQGSGDLADRVLRSRGLISLAVRQASERRIVSYGAALALAASLLFVISSWSAVEDIVAPRPALFDELVAWETLP